MRLIDADELMEHAWRDKLDSRELIAKMIKQAPTVKEIPTKIPIDIFEKLAPQEPCEDAINREDVLMALTGEWTDSTDELIHRFIRRIRTLPSVNPQPKTGHWRAVYQGDEIINYRCSECELGDTNGSTNLYGWGYCRRCGARMAVENG